MGSDLPWKDPSIQRKDVDVYICSCRFVKNLMIITNCYIVCDGIGDGKIRVAEWDKEHGLRLEARCNLFLLRKCQYLGQYKLGSVLDAIEKNSNHSYSSDYEWIKNVASYLGCCWNCSCSRMEIAFAIAALQGAVARDE